MKINDECKQVFEGMKMRHQYRYALFGFKTGDDKEIVVLKKADPSRLIVTERYQSFDFFCTFT